ncbi:MAG: hypothetical protein ACK4GN_18840 [Runella sp.]
MANKPFPLCLAIGIISTHCQPKRLEESNVSTNDLTKAEVVGNDLDAHGCKGSAGYMWSVVKNECIQIFKTGVLLEPQDSTLDPTLAAFVIFADEEKENQQEAEIFLRSGSFVLQPIKAKGADRWSNGTYSLSYTKEVYSLYKKEKMLYQGHRDLTETAQNNKEISIKKDLRANVTLAQVFMLRQKLGNV